MFFPASKPGLLDSLISDLAQQLTPVAELTPDALARTDYSQHLKVLSKPTETEPARIIPYEPNRAQRYFRQQRTRRDLILKSRQMGFSTEIQASAFLAAITGTELQATLAHDAETTQKLRRMAKRFYDGIPAGIRPARGYDNATTTTYPQTSSEVTIATAGSLDTGRGGTYTRFHGSEVAFWKDAGALLAGVMQGIPLGAGWITLESTPNGAQGWFYEQCMQALDGDTSWNLHFFPWWWDVDYRLPLQAGETLVYTEQEAQLVARHNLTSEQINWRRAKQKELGRLFIQEYPEDPKTCFLTSGNGYFSDIADLLERVFTAPPTAVYNPHHRYVAALDFGQKQDSSAMSVMDAVTLQEVDLWTVNRIPWGDIRNRALRTCQKWHVETLMPEANSMGTTNIEELHKEFKTAGCTTGISPFDMTAQSKPPLVTGFHWALDEGGLKLLDDPAAKQEILLYQAKQTANGHWQYEGLPHDDTVVARMICWHAISAPKQRSAVW